MEIKKRIIIPLLWFALLTLVLIWPSYAYAVEPNDNEFIINDEVDYSNASSNAIVEFNLLTGKTTIIEPENGQSLYQILELRTEPYIPEGLEVAPPPFSDEKISDPLIIGTKEQITAVNTYPYCAIAYLDIDYQYEKDVAGTASFIGESALLTAAHCVKHPNYGNFSGITVYPGGTGSSFGSDTVYMAYFPIQWANNYDSDYDYAVILISSNLGAQTGCFGTRAEPDANLAGKLVWSYGYGAPIGNFGTLWYDFGVISPSVSTNTFEFSCYVLSGDSGGPVVLQSDYRYIVGIISGSIRGNDYYNQAIRVTEDVVRMDGDYS